MHTAAVRPNHTDEAQVICRSPRKPCRAAHQCMWLLCAAWPELHRHGRLVSEDLARPPKLPFGRHTHGCCQRLQPMPATFHQVRSWLLQQAQHVSLPETAVYLVNFFMGHESCMLGCTLLLCRACSPRLQSTAKMAILKLCLASKTSVQASCIASVTLKPVSPALQIHHASNCRLPVR